MKIQLSDSARAILAEDCSILVVGGPGSGKTTLSLMKARALIPSLLPEQQILFLSFSRAAVHQVETTRADLLSIEDRPYISIRTYHAFALDVLRTHGQLLTGMAPHIIYPIQESVLKANFGGDWNTEQQRLAAQESRYTFNQFASYANLVISRSKPIAELVADKYPVIILDEFQDTNDSQWALVKSLSSRSCMIFLADPDQRIFDYDPTVNSRRIDQLRETLHPKTFFLGTENHRSNDSDILNFANCILYKRPLPKTMDITLSSYWPKQLEATVHVTLIQLLRQLSHYGITNPSVAVLTRTNLLASKLSAALLMEHTYRKIKLPPIDNTVLSDSTTVAAASLVIASILEWSDEGENQAMASTFKRIADYFDAKMGAKRVKRYQLLSSKYRKAERNVDTKSMQTCKGAKDLISKYKNGIKFLGNPSEDWNYVVNLLTDENDLSNIVDDVKSIKLFHFNNHVGKNLVDAWDRHGKYHNAASCVQKALEFEKVQSSEMESHGCMVMTIHKSKGKEFDGVVLVEGSYSDSFINATATEKQDNSARRLLRVGITRARKLVKIVRPRGAPPLVD